MGLWNTGTTSGGFTGLQLQGGALLGGSTGIRFGSSVSIADLKAEAKGWYDTEPTSLKTDLVALFDDTSGEYLSQPVGETIVLPGAFTASAWVKIDSPTASQPAILGNFLTGGNNRGFRLYVQAGQVRFAVHSSGTFNPGESLNTLFSLTVGQWYHVVAVFDPGVEIAVYVDGVKYSTPTTIMSTYDSGEEFTVGSTLDANASWDGELAHVALWDTVKSPADITTLYNGGTQQPIPPSLETDGVSYWPLNEPRGVRYDRWGTNHLDDINTVGTAHGPVEYQADNYAGITNLLNQGTAASPYSNATSPDLPTVPQLVDGRLLLGGGNFFDVTATLSAGTMIASTELGSLAMEYSGAAGATEMGSMGVFETYHADAENPVYGIAVFDRVLTAPEIAAVIAEFGGTATFAAATDLANAWRNCSSLTSFPLIDTSSATNLSAAWNNCANLTSFPLIDTSAATNLSAAWNNCANLTSFPAIDTSSAVNLSVAWFSCSGLTSFPLIDTSSATNLGSAWRFCSGLTSFPLIDTSSATSLNNAWGFCSGLTSFPLIDTSAATNLGSAWSFCSSLTSFPANAFDSSPCTNYTDTFFGCALDQTSVDNILVSINTAGTSGGTLDIDGGTSATPSATGLAAKSALEGRGWTVTVN